MYETTDQVHLSFDAKLFAIISLQSIVYLENDGF